ncbi:BZ3500_MvSof-1268-A1-R1_Chr6-3g08982 [Microbotryum saponariae]|uniref:BZ3500_MvSof-1268-A1-R1_Chr6-3g08982 protein n=1 Tax=Microbotryum saponariae TaxID=289078 RepID=A0A2X0LKF4_9BASI|nr:BZ3500_MvSof-1268-A1-R1_Chr6-3g08982 [Microbotryum saponariae]SDA07584.1 BZ3501_MvSof-1269-A2-R1_Chr6-2g08686 [Microbotryum saponariae]
MTWSNPASMMPSYYVASCTPRYVPTPRDYALAPASTVATYARFRPSLATIRQVMATCSALRHLHLATSDFKTIVEHLPSQVQLDKLSILYAVNATSGSLAAANETNEMLTAPCLHKL